MWYRKFFRSETERTGKLMKIYQEPRIATVAKIQWLYGWKMRGDYGI